jgi:hypothetical protein
MNLLLLLSLALPFACLALLSFVAFLGVAAIGGALSVIGMVTSALGIAGRKDEDPWRGSVSDAHRALSRFLHGVFKELLQELRAQYRGTLEQGRRGRHRGAT